MNGQYLQLYLLCLLVHIDVDVDVDGTQRKTQGRNAEAKKVSCTHFVTNVPKIFVTKFFVLRIQLTIEYGT